MKAYYGNYLGLCISNADPEQRGRVQIFIPHVMPALYDGWNKELSDRYIKAVGDNLQFSLTSDEIEKLRAVLPWAEGAMPILGPCSPGTLVRSSDGSYSFNQSPTTTSANVLSDDVLESLPAASKDAIFSFASVPSETQRRLKWESGGVVVNLDTNHPDDSPAGRAAVAAESQVAPLVVVPDNATPLQIELANTYAKKVEEAYREKFKTSLPSSGAIKRSVNSRGRAYTIHTEPFAVTDTKAVEYFTRDPVGRQKLAEITYTTLGRIPGVQFALPHGGIGGSPGATGKLGSEVDNASILLKDLYGLLSSSGGGGVPSRELDNFAPDPGSFQEYVAGAKPNPKTPQQMASPGTDPKIAQGESTEEWDITTPPEQVEPFDEDEQLPPVTTAPPGSRGVANMAPVFRTQYQRVYNALEGSRLIGSIPQGAQAIKYGVPDGSREQWAHLFTRMASVESSFDPNRVSTQQGEKVSADSPAANSFGIYQMGKRQFDQYGGQFGASSASKNWANPDIATKAFVKYAEALYFGDNSYGKPYGGFNSIAGLKDSQTGVAKDNIVGIAGGYGPLQRSITGVGPDGTPLAPRERELLAENIAASEKMSYGNFTANSISGDDASQVVQLTQTKNPNQGPPGIDPNNRVGGALGVPSPGATLWCFFREGNAQFPVYFAASYGAQEWSSAYGQVASPVPGSTYSTAQQPAESSGWNLNYGGAGLYAQKDINPEDNKQSGSQLTIYGEDGSHLYMGGRGYNEMVSRGDHGLTVDKNLFETVRMNKEIWVNGVNNMVVRGTNYKIVGNVHAESIEAVKKIQKIIEEAYQPLINSA